MSDRRWLPAPYMDKTIPLPRPSPSHWVEKLNDGSFCLAAAFEDDFGEPLRGGDILEFYWTEHLGTGEITVLENGFDLSVEEPSAPEGSSRLCWVPGVPDTISDDAAHLAESLKFGDRLRVDWYCWSDEPTAFIFAAGNFVECNQKPQIT